MIALSTTTYDPSGSLILPTRFNNPFHGQRRGSITETLDLSVSVYDGGYTLADKTLIASLKRPARALLVTLQYLVAYYSQLVLCCEDGAFLAVPSFTLSGDTLSLSFRVTARMDQ